MNNKIGTWSLDWVSASLDESITLWKLQIGE
jgi:hypothetical protein